jgi:1-deoxy-D-xylulose-5-phosphate reductoisomerase
MSPLTYEPVRHDVFPALSLGVSAGKRGGAAPAVFNAANEQAVARFLDGTLSFGRIAAAIESALSAHGDAAGETLDALIIADGAARDHVREFA